MLNQLGLAAIDNDANRKAYKKENKRYRLVPAQPDGYGGAYTRLNAGIRDQMNDEGNGEQSQAKHKAHCGFWGKCVGRAGP